MTQAHPTGPKTTIQHIRTMNHCSIRPAKITRRFKRAIDEDLRQLELDGLMLHHRGVDFLAETDPEGCFGEAAAHGEGVVVAGGGGDEDLDAEHVGLDV
jgi:hypothetical protein